MANEIVLTDGEPQPELPGEVYNVLAWRATVEIQVVAFTQRRPAFRRQLDGQLAAIKRGALKTYDELHKRAQEAIDAAK
jgi:hypothetical protein